MTAPSWAIVALCLTLTPALAAGPDTSPRPAERPQTMAAPRQNSDAALRDWVQAFRPRALAAGIDAATFDSAMAGATYDAGIIKRDRNQAEFTKTIWDYLDTAVSDLRITNGRAALARHQESLTQIQARYGVPKEIVVAIWGLESAYGTFRGDIPVVHALTTLAFDARRAEFFEAELLDALRILQAEHVSRDALRGSWAGASGHTQFMPSSFQAHAVDWTGDGRKNLWQEDPRDALASTAAYLKDRGWRPQQPWGLEVILPEDFDLLLADREVRKLPSIWQGLGVRSPDGARLEDHGEASILLPGGAEGAAFLIFDNFEVLESYNTADAYVVGVGHLADRIAGGAPFEQGWPRGTERALTFDERVELQERLTAAGFDTVKIDAKMGPLTVSAIRRFQTAQGLRADGFPSVAVLERLRAEP
ncbi:MAG: lytic murein transglycosylase [Sulfitobacter sp.]|nr:lytic murein transglycosylase [Sulfitobacter sp.]